MDAWYNDDAYEGARFTNKFKQWLASKTISVVSLAIVLSYVLFETLRVQYGMPEETKVQLRLEKTETKSQRIVLVAGPHKTGSSSIQTNFYNWVVEQENDVFDDWSWPVPSVLYKRFNETFSAGISPEKSFYPFT